MQISDDASETGQADADDSSTKEIDEEILKVIEELDTEGNGVPWEEVTRGASKLKIDNEALDDAINRLLDKGAIYEPVLGLIKKIEE